VNKNIVKDKNIFNVAYCGHVYNKIVVVAFLVGTRKQTKAIYEFQNNIYK